MNWNMFGTNWHLFGDLAAIIFIALLACGTGTFFYIRRLQSRPPLPISEGIGARRAVLAKLRKRQPLSPDELEFATRAVTDLRTPLAFCIPAATFSLGCLYVLGDNRIPEKSKDSRIFGAVNKNRVVGRCWIRIFPFSEAGPVD